MSETDPCDDPREMLSGDVETEFVDSVEELEQRIAADLQRGRDWATDDAATDGGQDS